MESEARAVFRHEREVRFRKDRPTSAKASKSARAATARLALDGADLQLFSYNFV